MGKGGVGAVDPVGPVPVSAQPVDLALYASTNTGSVIDTLANAFDATWQDAPNQPGTFSFKLPLGDSAIAACTAGRVVRFSLNSTARFAGIIERPASGRIISESDEGGAEFVTIKGSGLISDLDWAKVLPAPPSKSPGTIADIFPPIDDRPMEWYGMDYDDSTGWEDSEELGTHGETSAVSPGLPGGMRVLGAKWIWLTGAADDFLFFREWVFLYEGFYCLDFCCYDAAVYLNGRRHPRNAAYNAEAERVEFTVLNSGYVLLAFEADLRDLNYDAGLVWQITEGQEGALVYASGSACQVYGTPDAVLTMSSDEVLNALADGHPSVSDWTFDFGAGLDTDSTSLTGTHSIAPRIGADSIGSVLKSLAELYIDTDTEATGKTLQIWSKGTHANTPTTTWVPAGSTAGAAAPDTVNMVDLEWEQMPAEFDALVVRYQDGPFTRPATLPSKPRFEYLGIPHVPFGAIAIDFADRLLDAFGGDRPVATFTQLRDMANADLPYVGYDKWSTMAVPTRDNINSTTSMPVASITAKMDSDGMLDDVIVECGSFFEDSGTRLRRWIDVSSRGGMHGLVQSAQGVYATNTQRTPGLNQTEVVLFDFVDGGDDTTAARTMPGKGFLHKLIARVDSAAGGTSSMDVTVAGTTVTLTGTTASGFQLLDFDEGLAIPYGPRTLATIDITAVGHRKITVYAAVSETR